MCGTRRDGALAHACAAQYVLALISPPSLPPSLPLPLHECSTLMHVCIWQVWRAASTGAVFGGLLIPAYYNKVQELIPSRLPAAVRHAVCGGGERGA
jgi:hypothetical protein